jgi:hypothetical protein
MSIMVKGWRHWLDRLFTLNDQKVGSVTLAQFGDDGRRAEPVVVFTGNIGDAQVVCSLLEAYDIPAMVQSESMASVLGVVVGPLAEARVLVPEPVAERALSLLATEADDPSDDTEQTS